MKVEVRSLEHESVLGETQKINSSVESKIARK